MDKIILSERIKELRLSKKMTLAILAERLGITVSAVAAYENGTRNPSFDVLIKIAQIFNVTIDNLLGYTNKDLIDVSELIPIQRENIENLISVYKKFNILLKVTFPSDKNGMGKLEYLMKSDIEKFRDVIEGKNRDR